MGNPIIDLFKFLYNDIKTDILFVKDVIQGKREIRFSKEQWDELKDWRGILKENWLMFLVVLSAFCCGYFLAQVSLNNACTGAVEAWYYANPDFFTKQGVESLGNMFNLTLTP